MRLFWSLCRLTTVRKLSTLRYVKELLAPRVTRFSYLDAGDTPLSFREVLERWADVNGDGSLDRAFHSQVLSDLPLNAYRWETPVVDLQRFDRPFEFVVLDDPSLDRPEDGSAFRRHFDTATDEQMVLTFQNLGRNAVLVVPTLGGEQVNHCHLASFLNTCTASQESLLWHHVGKAMLKRVSDLPVWLSTAGGGVPWLHVRLDNKPKYYGHRPYRAA